MKEPCKHYQEEGWCNTCDDYCSHWETQDYEKCDGYEIEKED